MHTTETDEAGTVTPIDKPMRRWPGVVMSLLFSGFGLFRAGQVRRGIAWCIGLYAANLLTCVLMALEQVPVVVTVAGFLLTLAFVLWMLVDSYRPGRMTGKLWALLVLLVLGMLSLPKLETLIVHAFTIPSSGMEPTLMGSRDGNQADCIVVDRLTYRFSKPQRGDVLAFATSSITKIHEVNRSQPDDSQEHYFVKRVVGLPGERIEFKDGAVYADGRRLGPEDGIPTRNYVMSSQHMRTTFDVGANEYFVVGDNSGTSSDSRLWGGVPAAAVYGKATKIYYPLHRMGKVE